MKFHSFLPIAVDGFLTGSIQILSFQLKIKPLGGFFWIRLNSIQIQTFSVKFFSASCRSDLKKNVFTMPFYFCTVGFGLDSFAVQELLTLSEVQIEQVLVGKVFFLKDNHPEELLKLKTCERLFVKVIHCEVDADITSIEDWLTNKFNSCDSLPEKINTWKRIATCCQLVVDDCQQIKFRVNSRLSGKFRHATHFRLVSTHVANLLIRTSTKVNLVVDLQDPHLEVFLHLNDNFLTVGLQVTKRPLSDRVYLRHIAVRSTVCCALCLAVDLKKEDILLDPMCGAATILIEAVKQFHCISALGVDCDSSQLALAQTNLTTSSTHNQIDLILGDSRCPLLRKELFDVALCDVPFGRKFGNAGEIHQLLTRVVNKIEAVLKPTGRIGILISEHLLTTLIAICPIQWTLVCQYPLRLGTLPAAIVVWRK